MARTPDQVAQDLIDSIETTDSTLDTTQGPIPDIMIRPQAGQISLTEGEAESLRQLFTLQFSSVATDDEVRNALANFGSTPGGGAFSRVIQYFMRFTRPTDDIIIPAGSLVSNSDGSLVYRVINQGTIVASNADAYFNPNRNTYEIGLLIEATGTGQAYDLPRFRVNTVVTPIVGIDSTENRAQSSGGRDSETKDQQSTRLLNSLKGINLGAPGGITKEILDTLSDQVTDVAVIQPFEKEFARITDKPALDVYVIGESFDTTTETFEATAGQTQIFPTNVPVNSVTSLIVNNVSLTDFTLVNDLSPETGKSIRASDFIVVSPPLLSGDVVVVEYEFNKVLSNVETEVLDNGAENLFNTDILARLPFVVNPKISGEIKVLPSYSTTDVETNVLAYLGTTFTFTTFQSVIYPETVRQNVLTTIPGIQSFRITEFRRNTGALADIEPIVFLRNETSVFDSTLVNIKVVK